MSINSIHIHGVDNNMVLVNLINRLNAREIPFKVINNESPQPILNRVRGINYNPNTHFLVCCDYGGDITFRVIGSECEFIKYIDYLNLENAEII
jgi:hypothetical protein